jgi:hypothetical protein
MATVSVSRPVVLQEHDLAKVEVEGSSPFARSRYSMAYAASTRRALGLAKATDLDLETVKVSVQFALERTPRFSRQNFFGN